MKNPALILRGFAIVLAAIAAAIVTAPAISHAAATGVPMAVRCSLASRSLIKLAQDEGVDDEAVPSNQVDKYIAVYSAMQKNHGLTVDQAASKQGLTVDQFRALENKIEQNPVVHERVLDALKASSTGAKAKSNSAAAK